VRIGLVTPIVVRIPGAPDWESAAGPDDLVRIAEAADRLGYFHLTCSEHVAIPESVAAQRGTAYWDPLATLSFLAARTSRVRLVTNVLVLGYHHPLEIAKRYGTLDVLSAGRVVLGVGVGSLSEEFDLLGVPFTDRGVRADDALRALRACLSQDHPSYAGPFYNFSDLVVEPSAVQAHLPIWVGGRSARSLRRALALADGWAPFGLAPDRIRQMLSAHDTPDPFEVVLGPGRPFDPLGHPDETRAGVARLVAAGATIVNASFVHSSLDHCIEQMEAFAELVLR
jgi:probable F420-dependent oxidoreductase